MSNFVFQYVTPAAIEELKGSTGLTPDQIRVGNHRKSFIYDSPVLVIPVNKGEELIP